jgi:CRISPR/Cas system-associated protein Csm6
MKIIITTVGTSLFTNYLYTECTLSNYDELKIKTDYKCDESKLNKIRRDKNFQNYIKNNVCSAETTTLENIISELKEGEDYKVYLLCTDTCLSILAAEMLAKHNQLLKSKTYIIDEYGSPKQKQEGIVIQSLSITDPKKFKTDGLTHLVTEIRKIWNTKFDGHNTNQVVINASGGYKGIIPFLTLIAQLYELPVYYKYQDEQDNNGNLVAKYELIKIDALPFGFDWEMIYEIGPYLNESWIEEAKKAASSNQVVLKRLKKYSLIDKATNRITEIGMMIRAFYEGVDISQMEEVEQHTPQGGNRSRISSSLSEFKCMEWRMKIPYETNSKTYSVVSRSSDNEKLRLKNGVVFNCQIDIALEAEDKSGFILGEVKYAYKLSKKLARQHQEMKLPYASHNKINEEAEKLLGINKQIEDRLNECNDKFPDEFHVYAYTALPLSQQQEKILSESIKSVNAELRNKYAKLILKLFYGDIGIEPKEILMNKLTMRQIYPELTKPG